MGMSRSTEQKLNFSVSHNPEDIEVLMNNMTSLKIERNNAELKENKNLHNPLNLTNDTETDFEAALKEMNDREQRKSEIIIFGIPEFNSKSMKESPSLIANSFEYDNKMIRDIFKELGFGDDKCVPKFLKRLGNNVKKDIEKEQKPRPVVVSFYTQHEKELVISKTKLLKDSERFKNIRIQANLTLKQREQGKKERELVRKRNEEQYMLKTNQEWVWISLGLIKRKIIYKELT